MLQILTSGSIKYLPPVCVVKHYSIYNSHITVCPNGTVCVMMCQVSQLLEQLARADLG